MKRKKGLMIVLAVVLVVEGYGQALPEVADGWPVLLDVLPLPHEKDWCRPFESMLTELLVPLLISIYELGQLLLCIYSDKSYWSK